MKKLKTYQTVILYGLLFGALLLVLQWMQYRYLVRAWTAEFYGGAIALFFMVLGIWVGVKWFRKNKTAGTVVYESIPENFHLPELSQRELEVLELIAAGLSNQEIADRLYISLSTVKTHITNIFIKLDVKRRTEAVKKARDFKVIP